MKKINFILLALLVSAVAFGQAVKDRNIIPVSVSLNQVLRMSVTNGGNIDFVFSTIDDYKNGIGKGNEPMYQTDFTVSSSTRWKLEYGTEQDKFFGTDNPLNKLDLENVGFILKAVGTHQFAAQMICDKNANTSTNVIALEQYPITLIYDADAVEANAGDAADNSFTLNWRCGTAETGGSPAMNTVPLIEQTISPTPDRYVANVLFDLSIDN